MPKKKGNQRLPRDFTIYDSANSENPLNKKKTSPNKAVKQPETINNTEIPWDQIPDDEEYDIIEKVNPDGSMNLVCIKRRKKSDMETSKHKEYPEICWYHISKYVHPQDIGRFALINKTTYAITQQKSFWYGIYKRFCENSEDLPPRLRIEQDCKTFGLRTRVIRCLYFTHSFFINKVYEMGMHDSKPHDMIKHRCLNVWFHKGLGYWAIFLKFRKPQLERQPSKMDVEDLEKIDANPERECKVMQINCQFFYEVPPLIGMTLTSVKLSLSRGLRSHRLFMGFNKSPHVSKNVPPEYELVVDTVISVMLIDWWHPNYPHFKIKFDWDEEDERVIGDQERKIFAPTRKAVTIPYHY